MPRRHELGAGALAGSRGKAAPGRRTLKKESRAELDRRMRWWKDARFGMFIHWGVYSIPAGKWGDKNNYAEWIREEAHIPVHEYEKLQKQFNPVKFDAKAWAKMAKDAGMKYVVITTKHHDGFNMFFSHYTDWSIEHTPFHRDVVRELANAVRADGLHMGFYHSIMDWHHPDYLPRRSWEVADRPADGANFDRFVKYLHNDVSQLLTEYGPIGVMWFDGEWENTWNAKYGDALYALCREKQPSVIVNNRVSVGRNGIEDAAKQAGDYGTPEQTIPATGLGDQYWETCMTMNDHWGFNAADTDWKSTKTLIHNLVDIASKGGNYLLNIGPRSDGTFPPQAVDRLKEIGQWMNVNGESIYDTTASVFDNLPGARSTTRRHGNRTTIYLQEFEWPSLEVAGSGFKTVGLKVPSMANRILSARILGGPRCTVTQSGDDVWVNVPPRMPNSIATVIKLEIEGAPVVYKAPVIKAPTNLIVGSTSVTIKSSSPGLTVRYSVNGPDPTWASSVYNGPIVLPVTSTVRAASFVGKRRVSEVVKEKFTAVEPWASPDGAVAGSAVSREVYRGSWDKLPDFGSLTAESQSDVTVLSVPMMGGKPVENIGLRYSGVVQMPKTGVYTFALSSDDGAKLWIDDKLVVDNDGTHAPSVKTGSAPLKAGPHTIQIGWFNKTGDADLSLKFGLVGSAQYPLAHYLAGK